MDFTTSIVASIIAGILVLIVIYYYKKMKSRILSLQSSACEYVFKNQSAAEDEILEMLNKANWVNIFICRGYSLIEPDRKYYSGIRNASNCRILLSKPKLPNGQYNEEVVKRVNELPSSKGVDAYISNIEEVINVLKKETITNKNINYKLHEEPIIFRMYMFPNSLYLSFFEEDVGASKSMIFKYNSKSIYYKGFKKYFERVWEKSN